ncbi:DUF2249 domain-containing protein [Natronomonas halophila]|uniref:DUF2249 domain-containing protein n=1 Tax=Natronomonas halophila TaxID=2747817 RepID=UPI0015B644CC|nr:DUF2249 domain-containing protein [Natronomonas halophila]QLD85679.1 DUF2249 domain-containing protein [Natronomonas halophila]
MTTLDTRSDSLADRRETVFEALDAADAGETVTLVTDDDAAVLLAQYRMKRRFDLQWETDEQGDTAEVHVTKGEPLDEGELADFDVRDMPPQRRHEVLTDTFDWLDSGEGFVLVNDHDPKPLYHELRSTRGDVFEWEDTNRDPQEWRVEIRKTDETRTLDPAVAASFDVREIPKEERHPTIHHRYGNIADGETLEIIAPHEPKPLHREFQQRYGDAFEWDIIEHEPGHCRVHVTKRADDGASSSSGSLTVTEELDVRELPPAQRHERIFEAYDDLQTGQGFVLVNDHDPKPLYHQFDAEAGDEFYWEYRQKEPGEFRVLIGKDETADVEIEQGENPEAPF